MRAGVQTARNITVGVCEPGEHGERSSGKYELKPWVTCKRTLRDRESRSEKRATEPSGCRAGDEIQTGDCEARPEKRAARVVGAVGAETAGS
jgi:hypothetical protein